jgi:ABC-type Mn2+/Zn2+ transport system ATPase subunit
MIRSIDIQNFRCFKHLHVAECSRLNVLVGDNGTGKTALLEAIFLPLAAGVSVAMRLRAQRGLDASFTGPARRIEAAIWGDFFHQQDFHRPISLVLEGDSPEARSLTVFRGTGELVLPLDKPSDESGFTASQFVFRWRDAAGHVRDIVPSITSSGLRLPDTGEDLPDFFHFPANQTISSVENAGRFSDLSKSRQHHQFVELFAKEYEWLEDINVEVVAGSPALYATLLNVRHKLPLANVSGGINRIVGIMLAIASRPRSVVLVDEIENGIYYQHQAHIWRGLLSFMRNYDSQLFVTTHSEEWLEALLEAADGNVDDIALWRLERGPNGPILRQFGGSTFKAGIESGGEVR